MQEFTALMTKLRARYQNAVADQAMWEASVLQYWEDMQSSDPDKIRQAFDAVWRKHSQWMPSCGQLMDLIDGGGLDTKQLARDAWPQVYKAATGARVELDSVASEVLRRMGGAKALGQRSEAELRLWGQKEFVELYVEEHKKSEEDKRLLGLGRSVFEITDGR